MESTSNLIEAFLLLHDDCRLDGVSEGIAKFVADRGTDRLSSKQWSVISSTVRNFCHGHCCKMCKCPIEEDEVVVYLRSGYCGRCERLKYAD